MAQAPTKNLLPDLEPDQYESLKESIREHGFWPENPIVVDQHGNVLDGWNRKKAADELGVEAPTVTRHVDTDWDGIVYAFKANTHRRHLTPAARRQALKRLKEMLDAELKRRGKEAQKAGARQRSTRSVSPETKVGRAREAAADASSERFDAPVVAVPKPPKEDRLGTLADVLGSSRATVARDEKVLERIETIEKEAARQHRDDVIRMLNAPRPNLDELERALKLRDPLPDPATRNERPEWLAMLAKSIDNLQGPMMDDEADALLDALDKPELVIIQLRQWTKVVAERGLAKKKA